MSLLGAKGLKMRAIIQKVREETSLFEVARLYHFNGMNKQCFSKLGNLSAIHTFHIAYNASCFNLPLTYFHVELFSIHRTEKDGGCTFFHNSFRT